MKLPTLLGLSLVCWPGTESKEAARYPVPPYNRSGSISAAIAFQETVFTGVPSDTWPSVWAENGKSYAFGGDMPGKGQFECKSKDGTPIVSYANSWEISMESSGEINVTLLNCQPVNLTEVYDVCSGGKPGSVFVAPNLKPVSMLAIGGRILVVVQCTYYPLCFAAPTHWQSSWSLSLLLLLES